MLRKLKEEVEEKGLILSNTENGKEGESRMIDACRCLESKITGIQ